MAWRASTKLSVFLVGGGSVAGIAGYRLKDDEEARKLAFGLQRSATFWSNMLPIYLHYRFTQWRVKGLPEDEQLHAYEPLHELYAPKALDLVLKLKGFYVKLGQIASTRSDFLPDQYFRRVATLQDQTPPEPFAYIRRLVETSLHRPMEEVFESLEETPLGAASIGQAHRGRLRDGREVVVKVMFPDVETMFRSDMKTMKDFCRLAQPEHLVMLNEVEKQFLTEFDYVLEGQNLLEVRRNMVERWGRKVKIPEPYQATHDVLIMEYIPGTKLVDALRRHFETIAREKGMTVEELRADIEAREAKGEKISGPTAAKMAAYQRIIYLKDLAGNTPRWAFNWLVAPVTRSRARAYRWTEQPLNTAEILELLFKVHGHQIFVDGAFNGDPHPGNILLTPDGKLGLIDYGQVKHIGLEPRLRLAKLIVALAEEDKPAVVQAYTEMGFRTKYMNPDVIYTHAKCVFDNDHKDSLGGTNIQMYLEELQRQDPVENMPDEYIMAGRVAVLLRGLSYALKYNPSSAKMWETQARQLLAEHEDLTVQSIHQPAVAQAA